MDLMRKVISTLLSVMMVFSMLSIGIIASPSEVSAATASQTQFGDLTWSVSEDGTLTVSGSGTMQNKNNVGDYPWGSDELQASVKKVVIEDGVTSVGQYAFNYFKNLKEVVVAESVTSIGESAFYNNSGCTIQFLGNAPSIGWDIINEDSSKVIAYKDATGFEGETWYYNIERIDRPDEADPEPEPMTITADKTTINVGEELTLKVANAPEGAFDFTWRNNNKDCFDTYYGASYNNSDNPDQWTITPKAAGEMTVTVVVYNDDFDQLGTATLTITVVEPQPEVEPVAIHADKTTICVGEELTLSAVNAPEGSHDFEWRNSNKDVYGVTYYEKSYYTDDNPDQWTITPKAAGEMTISLRIYNDDFDQLGETATITIAVVEHNYAITKEAKEATCTEAGNTEETTCTNCGDVKGGDVIEATGHAYKVTKEAKAATCTETGNTEETTCANCGDVKGGDVIEATGHAYKATKEAKAATCTETGNTEETTCANCGDVKGGEAIEATGHSYKTTITKATTKADGKIVEKCSVCEDTKTTVIKKIASVSISKAKYVYDGNAKKPVVTVKDASGKIIDAKNYTVAYKNNKKVGKAAVTVTLSGNYEGTATKNFKINPKATKISSLTKGKKSFTVKWTKVSAQTTGYEIQYSTSKSFKKGTATKTVKVTSAKTASKTVKNLKANKKYYVQVRTYKTVNGEKCYSTWSKTKTVTTK